MEMVRKMDLEFFDTATQQILTVIPERALQLSRFRAILQAGTLPTVTVIGKYNHGKSRLLNELIGEDIFSVADKRETTTLSEHLQQQVRWLDAPGLDADVAAIDDQHAQDAIWTKADIRLFVHSVREGEFDPNEVALFQQLEQDTAKTQRQTLLVLTQIDQIADKEVLNHILDSIQQQVPTVNLLAVSATRHRQGVENNKQLLIQRSGIPELKHILHSTLEHVPTVRLHEKNQILNEIKTQLIQLQHSTQYTIQQLSAQQQQQRQAFEQGLEAVLSKVREDLQPILVVSDKDDSLEPDSFANMYKVTAGKRDRNRIQVAYSRACIDINSHLIRHGVVELPETQKSHVRSLDTIIVAVLGVSVKLRKDLQRIFFEEAGLNHLRHEFARYFELSTDRVALQQQRQNTQQQLDHIETALQAVSMLESAQ